MKPETLAKAGTEHAHQAALFCWAAHSTQIYPELLWLFAVPNGGQRNIVTAVRLRAEGVRSGVSDIILPAYVVLSWLDTFKIESVLRLSVYRQVYDDRR